MPKDSFLIGTPPHHSSNHFSRIALQQEKKYENINFTRLLGRGTFSQVYLSQDTKTGESLAVKVMDLRRFEEEFNSEVSIMMNLTQKGVNVNFLSSEVDEDNDTGYIYMNYIPFPTLSELLEKATFGFKEEEAMKILNKLVDVIDSIHSCNVAHKDLKPENIFVDLGSHEVSVIDFGLSSVLDGKKEKKFCGSPLYMAPEMLNKEPYDPVQADIWSIGVILYEMLIGCNPWSSAECLEDLVDLLTRIEFPSSLSPQSIGLLSGMLILDPIQRDSLQKIKSKIESVLQKQRCDTMSMSL